MTPKEKAKELVERYINLYPHQREDYLNNEDAELCALIAVDEIIKSNPTTFYEEIIENIGYTAIRECNSNYWQEVKQEIFKL
jgi:hypothetical protein